MRTFIGIDSSTTATKALLIDETGAVLGVAATEYGYATPQPLWSEQDPELWWDGTVGSIRAVLAQTGIDPADVAGIGLTGQMHGLVLLDEHGEVLRPGHETVGFAEGVGGRRVAAQVGFIAMPGEQRAASEQATVGIAPGA